MSEKKISVKAALKVRLVETSAPANAAVLEITTADGPQYFALGVPGCLSTARLLIRKAEELIAPAKKETH
jgi:hypothetical protein